MASLCRSAARTSTSTAARFVPLLARPPTSQRVATLISRSVAPALLDTVDSLMPLHSAIASARLKSFIAVDSRCWSWLSQDFAVPR